MRKNFKKGILILTIANYRNWLDPLPPLTLFVPKGQVCSPLCYFIKASKQKSFALMHTDFKSNLITHIFKKFGVSQITGNDVIAAFVRGS